MVKGFIKENKKAIIISGILWLITAIVLVVPFAYGFFAATCQGKGFLVNTFTEYFLGKLGDPFGALGDLLRHNGAGTLLICELVYTIVFLVIVIIAIKKSNSNHEYYDIEHASSDWS